MEIEQTPGLLFMIKSIKEWIRDLAGVDLIAFCRCASFPLTLYRWEVELYLVHDSGVRTDEDNSIHSDEPR
jgi:hypothetical protein